jgi:FkbM family methyltransferase
VLRRGRVVFDIGAHVGFYTLLAAECVGPSGRVIAFEPVPANLGYLRRHVALNRMKNVSVIASAVSDREGKAWFEEGHSSSTGHITDHGRFQVDLVALDSLCFRGELPLPDVIKIDVEGAEADVLAGARSVLLQACPILFVATHSRELHVRCCELLSGLGYSLRPIGAPSIVEASEFIAAPGRSSYDAESCRVAVP